jgi:Domain of unknown function DUF302
VRGFIDIFWLWNNHAMTADGLIMVPSSYGPKETMDRLVTEVAAKGLTILARIDHAAGAAQVSLPLRPTELLIFGNAKAGTPLMTIKRLAKAPDVSVKRGSSLVRTTKRVGRYPTRAAVT